MFFYAKETNLTGNYSRTAGVKARDDIESIFSEEGFIPIEIPSLNVDRASSSLSGKLLSHKRVYAVWKKSLERVHSGDVLVVQFPVIEHSIGLASLFKKKKKEGIKLVLLIHDLELFRYAMRKDISLMRKLRLRIEELSILSISDRIVVHNDKMKKRLSAVARIPENRMISLGIFDYLIDSAVNDSDNIGYGKGVIISGNLDPRKAGYVYDLPDDVDFNLYGVNYEMSDNENVVYHGSFSSDEIVNKMEGSFGLVWDGVSAQSCKGVFGEYLRINNPHKTSLYLAAGLPIIIWRDAALAEFIKNNGLGILVDSIFDISNKIHSLTQADYDSLLSNVKNVSKLIRQGQYTRNVIRRIKELYDGDLLH